MGTYDWVAMLQVSGIAVQSDPRTDLIIHGGILLQPGNQIDPALGIPLMGS